MQWSDVVKDPSLRDLPYKIELNERGQVVLSQATRWHACAQTIIASRLDSLGLPGEAYTECPVQTRKGVRVPNAAWASDTLIEEQAGDVFDRASEICVEVVSKSNTPEEIEEKIGLYFEAGAQEVWTCDLNGSMRFFDANGPLERSRLAPTFPAAIRMRR